MPLAPPGDNCCVSGMAREAPDGFSVEPDMLLPAMKKGASNRAERTLLDSQKLNSLLDRRAE